MSSNDFIIENGVLKKYTGNGGDVVIPDGITEIGSGAFDGVTERSALSRGLRLDAGEADALLNGAHDIVFFAFDEGINDLVHIIHLDFAPHSLRLFNGYYSIENIKKQPLR